MGNFIKTQSSFANGIVAPEFYANDNINGLARLQNMDVMSGGGFTRRPGLVSLRTLNKNARLIPFSVADNEEYLLLVGNMNLMILRTDGTLVRDMAAPWPLDVCSQIQYAQRFGTMVFVHPDYQPRILRRQGGIFTLELYDFARNDVDLSVNIPFMRFDDSVDINISVSSNSGGNNYATLTASADFFTSDSVGALLDMLGHQWNITSVTNARTATALVNGGYTLPTAPVTEWRECAFSARRGWPRSITFHQDRLVFGGSRDYPGGVWMSQVGKHNNFSVGTGLDDEAIFITLLSDQRQQICTVVSSDNLQILTSVGEWAISSRPLTPSSVDIRQHTSVGSITTRYLPPQKIEGATVFIASTGRDIRELSLDELGEHYNATDLCTYAKHLMQTPVDIAYNAATHQLFVVMDSGDMAVLNKNSALDISAWGTYQTAGQFKSVAVIDDITFVIVCRDNVYYLERFDSNALSDVNGIPFSCIATALPLRTSGHNTDRLRIRKITARILDSKTLFINGVRATLPNCTYDVTSPGFSGDVSVNVLGTSRDFNVAPWQISTTDTLPLTVLSVTIYGHFSI